MRFYAVRLNDSYTKFSRIPLNTILALLSLLVYTIFLDFVCCIYGKLKR